jgi:precorrin-6B methylase 2
MNELKCGKVHDKNLILNNIIPFLQNDKSKIILDIGSHIGSHSIMYANILNNCKIYAFEPQNVLKCAKV